MKSSSSPALRDRDATRGCFASPLYGAPVRVPDFKTRVNLLAWLSSQPMFLSEQSSEGGCCGLPAACCCSQGCGELPASWGCGCCSAGVVTALGAVGTAGVSYPSGGGEIFSEPSPQGSLFLCMEGLGLSAQGTSASRCSCSHGWNPMCCSSAPSRLCQLCFLGSALGLSTPRTSWTTQQPCWCVAVPCRGQGRHWAAAGQHVGTAGCWHILLSPLVPSWVLVSCANLVSLDPTVLCNRDGADNSCGAVTQAVLIRLLPMCQRLVSVLGASPKDQGWPWEFHSMMWRCCGQGAAQSMHEGEFLRVPGAGLGSEVGQIKGIVSDETPW